MELVQQAPLQCFNTLALPAQASYFYRVASLSDLIEAVAWASDHDLPLMILGGGSNVVLADDWPGLTIQIALRGRRIVSDNTEQVLVEAAAGENWHELVQWTLAEGLCGLENLTLIPGTVGAAPIQNIGAYGVELADRLVSVRGWSLDDQCERELSAAACRLAYRDSIFKHELRDRFVITVVTLGLSRSDRPVIHYPALRDALAKRGVPPETATAVAVEAAVRAVRQSKLPDPTVLANAGSFFKNPIVSRAQFERLQNDSPTIPGYPAGDQVKLAAAWLVDQAGWKGKRRGGVGVHTLQALVLVHFGGADGRTLLALAAAIQRDVWARFGVQLELEPRVYPQAVEMHATSAPTSGSEALPPDAIIDR